VRNRKPSNLLGGPQPTKSLEGLTMYDQLMVVHPLLPEDGLRRRSFHEQARSAQVKLCQCAGRRLFISLEALGGERE
jgi:hypothetical protein